MKKIFISLAVIVTVGGAFFVWKNQMKSAVVIVKQDNSIEVNGVITSGEQLSGIEIKQLKLASGYTVSSEIFTGSNFTGSQQNSGGTEKEIIKFLLENSTGERHVIRLTSPFPNVNTGEVYQRIGILNPERFQIDPYLILFSIDAKAIGFTGKDTRKINNLFSSYYRLFDSSGKEDNNNTQVFLSGGNLVFSDHTPFEDVLTDKGYYLTTGDNGDTGYSELYFLYPHFWYSDESQKLYQNAISSMQKGIFIIDDSSGLNQSLLAYIWNKGDEHRDIEENIINEVQIPHWNGMIQSKAYIIDEMGGGEPYQLTLAVYGVRNSLDGLVIVEANVLLPVPKGRSDDLPSSEVYDTLEVYKLSGNQDHVKYRRKCVKENNYTDIKNKGICAAKAYYSTDINKKFVEKVANDLINRFQFNE